MVKKSKLNIILGGVNPFQVYCDMDSSPGRGITVIHHANSELPVTVSDCEDPGCFPHTIDYQGISISQITSLMQKHVSCEQHIRYDCFESKVNKELRN